MIRRLLIANRGEIAVRLVRAAADAGIESVALHDDDDPAALHLGLATRAVALGGSGPAAWLDIARIVALARQTGCDAVPPKLILLAQSCQHG